MQIPLHQITGHQHGPHLLILGGVHGDEYEPIAAIRRLMQTLSPQELTGTVTLVPIVNIPAFERLSRTGPDGLDLARTFPGKPDGSTTEQIAAACTELIRSADFLIDLHTGGLAARIAPLAGYMLSEDIEIRSRQRAMAEAFNLPIVWGTSPKLNGRSLSAARDAGVPAIYAEWGGGGGCQTEGVSQYVQGCRNVMSLLGMLNEEPPPRQVRYLVEDAREESGVLQKNYLAEQAGYFEPAVQLHDQVQIGQTLGWIFPTDLGPAIPVASRQQGLVILLRATPATQPGDFLAVILDADRPGEFHYE